MEDFANDHAKTESWSQIEQDSFLLGLYLFGKNLDLVNKFMGNKGMSNILPYYYGKFYKSNQHQKWSEYRKKSKIINENSVPGETFFTGWRQQDLFSRLFSNVTDECKTSLTQASRMFEDGKLTFEKYVFGIKDMVGIERLVQAVAIGNDKRDLTTLVEKSVEDHNKLPSYIYSSLETEEIVNLVKYGITLNQEELSELFWEAVWPRLLARGWHSQQTKSYVFPDPDLYLNQSLVFLPPDIKKFSRRGLKKGIEYFESLSDVLSKVAFEPHLLELEPNNFSLDPHEKEQDQDVMQFIIMDSSLVYLGKGVTDVRVLSDTEQDEEASQESQTTAGQMQSDPSTWEGVGGGKKRRIEAEYRSPMHLLAETALAIGHSQDPVDDDPK